MELSRARESMGVLAVHFRRGLRPSFLAPLYPEIPPPSTLPLWQWTDDVHPILPQQRNTQRTPPIAADDADDADAGGRGGRSSGLGGAQRAPGKPVDRG